MFNHKITLTLLVILVFLSNISAQEPRDPKLNISLSKFQYTPNQQLEGNIILSFNNPAENKNLELWLGGNSFKKPLMTILSELNHPFNASAKRTTLFDDANSIIFPALEQTIGFETSIGANNASIDILSPVLGTSSEGSYPKFSYMDIGADGSIEWKWLGSITTWSEFKGSIDLDTSQSTGSSSINEKKVYVCEIIDVPHEINEIKISAKFEILKPNTDMWAAMFIPSGTIDDNFEAGFIYPSCDLPDGTIGQKDWRECTINFENPNIVKEGKKLICIYAENSAIDGSDIFSVSTDSGVAGVSAVKCSLEEGKTICISKIKNYFIRASIPSYDGILSTQDAFERGLVKNSDGSDFVTEIKRYMGLLNIQCIKTSNGNCVVPLTVGAQSAGTMHIGAVKISIKSPGESDLANFRKLKIEPEIINKIDNQALANFTFSIPLSYFQNFTTQDVDNFLLIPFRVVYGLESDQEPIQIFKTVSGGITNETLSNTISSINDYNSDAEIRSILSFLTINTDTAKSTLSSLKTQLETLEANATIAQDVKSQKRNEILTDVQEARANIPQVFLFKNKVPFLPAIPPSRVNREKILPLSERTDDIERYILAIQSRMDIETKATAFKLITYSGTSIDKTFIVRKVSTSLPNSFLIEEIPSYIAADASSVDFGNNQNNVQVLDNNPLLIKMPLTSGQNTLAYMVNGDIVNQIGNIKTLVVSTEGITSSPTFQGPTCGDGACYPYLENEINCPADCAKKIPWTGITIVILVLVLGIYYINFYRGVGNIRSLLKKKGLFKTEVDKINLINYIHKAQKRTSIEKIRHILLSKGWTKKQVDYAIKKASEKK